MPRGASFSSSSAEQELGDGSYQPEQALSVSQKSGVSIIRNRYWVLCAEPILEPEGSRKNKTASLASSSLQ